MSMVSEGPPLHEVFSVVVVVDVGVEVLEVELVTTVALYWRTLLAP
jgi:hypothetical protein